ncbi:hypothetical protein SAMN05216232_1411 [Virgibacillus subterraneus]|uniref:Uncharacterized protein n=2 Tax=Virgibacillus TaxID=84406 RepID=A0A1H0ZKL6_9BACI|nr:hypothetical protein SAMN05216231_1295 [Virgibacillus salinus]SEP94640.1 hypothetical protein SAMN05216232_1411 [Virgibacillus subterraneus]
MMELLPVIRNAVSVLVRPKTPEGGFLHGKANARNGRV